MNLKEFGRYFAEVREKSGYRSQRELADASGVSHSTINRIEAGTHKVSTESLKSLAPYLKGVSYEELLAKSGYLEQNNSDQNLAFFNGGEELTDEEVEYLKESLELFRKMRARRIQEK